MKKSIILGMVVCAVSFNSLSALATSDDKYPASNFEPTVTYIDESAIQEQPSATDDKYPASNFQPKVTYIDENVEQTQITKASVVDPKYPASNFESKVIYSDESATASVPVQVQPDQFDPKYPAAYFKPKIIYP